LFQFPHHQHNLISLLLNFFIYFWNFRLFVASFTWDQSWWKTSIHWTCCMYIFIYYSFCCFWFYLKI
jgi:hypothetical protein